MEREREAGIHYPSRILLFINDRFNSPSAVSGVFFQKNSLTSASSRTLLRWSRTSVRALPNCELLYVCDWEKKGASFPDRKGVRGRAINLNRFVDARVSGKL